jgi:hypothetical protein
MKKTFSSTLAGIATCSIILSAGNALAQTNTVPFQIGVYDSRAVAYAWFVTAARQHQIAELVREAKAGKAAGDNERFQKLRATLQQTQAEIHREAFSTAAPTEALAQIKNRLPIIERDVDVKVLVSKWDDATLKEYPAAKQLDVTDRLVREFIQPTEQQLKTISDLEKSKPLPLEKCNEMIREGKI